MIVLFYCLKFIKNKTVYFNFNQNKGYVANGRSCCCGVAVQCTRNSKTLTAFTPQRPLALSRRGGAWFSITHAPKCSVLSPISTP